MIVVTGVTGHVGGLVAAELARLGVPFRAIVRDERRAPALPGMDVVVADYGDADALAAALDPGDRVFMVSLHEEYERRVALHQAFVEVASRRVVGRVVYLSFISAGPGAHFRHARSHGATESMLAAAGLPFTAVRNGMYADEIASWFDSDGRLTGPGGEGRVSLSLRSELGEAVAVLLMDARQDDRQVVNIAGPEAPTLAELAAAAAEVTGDPYRYAPVPRADWIDYRRALGRPEWSIEAGITYYDGVAAGEAGVLSTDYHDLTGKQPATIREVIARYRDAMPLARAGA